MSGKNLKASNRIEWLHYSLIHYPKRQHSLLSLLHKMRKRHEQHKQQGKDCERIPEKKLQVGSESKKTQELLLGLFPAADSFCKSKEALAGDTGK